MKKIFFWILNKYSNTEKDRLEIYSFLNKKVSETYHEQNMYGNFYNAFIEFVISNNFIKSKVKIKDDKDLDMIKNGIQNAFDKSLNFIKNEDL